MLSNERDSEFPAWTSACLEERCELTRTGARGACSGHLANKKYLNALFSECLSVLFPCALILANNSPVLKLQSAGTTVLRGYRWSLLRGARRLVVGPRRPEFGAEGSTFESSLVVPF